MALSSRLSSRLIEIARHKVVSAAKRAGIQLKQTFAKEGKELRRRAVSGLACHVDDGHGPGSDGQAAGFQRCGSNSSMRWFGCASKRSSTSVR